MSEVFNKAIIAIFILCSILITAYVLFLPPRPGVADQGDFQRVMDVTGLIEKGPPEEETESLFFKYVKSEYIMAPVSLIRLLGIIPTTSMIYPITVAKTLCRIGGSGIFNTEVLAFVYSVMYITALTLCIKWGGTDAKIRSFIAAILSLLILMDGNYLVWFNSLYGEPMMIIGLVLFSASILNVSNKIDCLTSKDLLFVFISSILFLGSKAQCISALPLVVLMILRVYWLKDKARKAALMKKALIPVILIVFYTLGFYLQINATCGVDTKYNSVFYGILKDSENPERDLQILGLSPDMAAEAGKHAYLPETEYEKYAPWSEITLKEFNGKISYFKIIKFYLLNPGRLIQGMEYTASQSFKTSSFLGKYKKTDIQQYTYQFGRFTFWSDIREKFLPNKLAFIVFFYVITLTATVINYPKAQKKDKVRIELVWFIAAVGIFQFPMPYLGNGRADTAKQLFLFNYTFDILIIILAICIFQFLVNLAKHRKFP
ncbi:glycan biosynthesis hexose transferase WsfD [Thermoclostridium stercorarium]|jgi:hypothetical protein|nr:hypothetical protein [Thermoclostridium stercorarium]